MRALGTVRRALPWWARMAAKIVLARLPVPYPAWRRLSLFRHGEIDEPAYAFQVVVQHLERARFTGEGGLSRSRSDRATRLPP
jgi:hypothetical protein